MKIEVVAIIIYIVVVMAACKLWSNYIVKKYNQKKNALSGVFYAHISDLLDGKIELAGDGPDGNNDYEVAKAILKVNVSEDTRVKL